MRHARLSLVLVAALLLGCTGDPSAPAPTPPSATAQPAVPAEPTATTTADAPTRTPTLRASIPTPPSPEDFILDVDTGTVLERYLSPSLHRASGLVWAYKQRHPVVVLTTPHGIVTRSDAQPSVRGAATYSPDLRYVPYSTDGKSLTIHDRRDGTEVTMRTAYAGLGRDFWYGWPGALWSRSGRYFTCASGYSDGSRVVLVDTLTFSEQVVGEARSERADDSWRPSADQFVFENDRAVFLYDVATAHRTKLADGRGPHFVSDDLIVYSVTGPTPQWVVLNVLTGEEITRLPESPLAAWSHGGQHRLMVRIGKDCDVVITAAVSQSACFSPAAAYQWSPDGVQIAIVREHADRTRSLVVRHSASGVERTLQHLSLPQSHCEYTELYWSLDGKRLAVIGSNSRPGSGCGL